MAGKTKGINAERDLIHLFWSKGIAAVRVAGSGSSTYPSPDLVVGKNDKKMVIECKSSKDSKKYFSIDEIEQLKEFSTIFGARPVIALKFNRQNWSFLDLNDLKMTGKCFVADNEVIKEKGLDFENISKHFIY